MKTTKTEGKRYFVDSRIGCCAIRDRTLTDQEYQGLHVDTPGVIQYWGYRPLAVLCPACGHVMSSGWEDGTQWIAEAEARAAQLNEEEDE